MPRGNKKLNEKKKGNQHERVWLANLFGERLFHHGGKHQGKFLRGTGHIAPPLSIGNLFGNLILSQKTSIVNNNLSKNDKYFSILEIELVSF